MGVRLWIWLPTNKCAPGGPHLPSTLYAQNAKQLSYLKANLPRQSYAGSARPMDEKVAIVNELDQWFSSCLEAVESSYSGRFWVVPPLTELLGSGQDRMMEGYMISMSSVPGSLSGPSRGSLQKLSGLQGATEFASGQHNELIHSFIQACIQGALTEGGPTAF